ncbi:MAG: acyltransferase [Acidobacteriota bacterium]
MSDGASRTFGTSVLRRMSRATSGEFIPEIDGLRFIAIAAVVLHHLMAAYLTDTQRLGRVELPADWIQTIGRSLLVRIAFCGYFGVHLFFVISGFVLSLPFARACRQGSVGPSLRAYYWRRIRRIEPPYFINLTLCFALIVATLSGWRVFVPHYLASLAYLHGIVFGEPSWISGVTWSLEIEIQFYLLVPLLVGVFRVRHAGLRRIVLIALVFGLSILSPTVLDHLRAPRLGLSLLNYLQYFFAGFLLADLYLDDRRRNRSLVWDLLAAIVSVLMVMIISRHPGGGFLLPALVIALFVTLFLGRVAHQVITLRPIVICGGMCYTIYLYHNVIINLLQPSLGRLSLVWLPLKLDFLIQSLLMLPVIAVVCVALFVLVERPFMTRWKSAADKDGTAPVVAT